MSNSEREELRQALNTRFDSVTSQGHVKSCGEYQTAIDDAMQLIDTYVESQKREAAKRDYKFISEVLHRLDDSQDNFVDFEGAIGMLEDWEAELKELQSTQQQSGK